MQGLHPVDITVIVLYLVGIAALGIWMARRVKQVSDFFMPRRFGKGMMIRRDQSLAGLLSSMVMLPNR